MCTVLKHGQFALWKVQADALLQQRMPEGALDHAQEDLQANSVANSSCLLCSMLKAIPGHNRWMVTFETSPE